MPVDSRGQKITFATEKENDRRYLRTVIVPVRRGDTMKKIASRYGFGEEADVWARMNNISSVRKVLTRKSVKIPGKARPSSSFSVLAGDEPPRVTNGYAKFDVMDRPGRTGLTTFKGYDPITLEVPIRFEAFVLQDGTSVEDAIEELERMAGRGNYKGAAVGPPGVIQVQTRDAAGNVVSLIPSNYQASAQNPSAPFWRVAGIEWDDSPLRDGKGRRIRQKAVVTLQQHTQVTTAIQNRSAAERARFKASQKKASRAEEAAVRAARRAARR